MNLSQALRRSLRRPALNSLSAGTLRTAACLTGASWVLLAAACGPKTPVMPILQGTEQAALAERPARDYVIISFQSHLFDCARQTVRYNTSAQPAGVVAHLSASFYGMACSPAPEHRALISPENISAFLVSPTGTVVGAYAHGLYEGREEFLIPSATAPDVPVEIVSVQCATRPTISVKEADNATVSHTVDPSLCPRLPSAGQRVTLVLSSEAPTGTARVIGFSPEQVPTGPSAGAPGVVVAVGLDP